MTDDATTDEPFVRPYMITAGRTVGGGGDVALETMVSACKPAIGLDEDRAAVLDLCESPISIAEIGALSSVPIGVARVLVADLIASGHLEGHETAAVDDTAIVRRLLNGIRAL